VRPALLTHPPIPAPLHGVNPRTAKGQKWWDETRYIAYEGNNRHCWACAARTNRLDAHECYDIDFTKGIAVFVEVVALCKMCHAFIHSNRLTALTKAGIHALGYWEAVRDHGYSVLETGGFEPSPWARVNFEPGWTPPDDILYAPTVQWGEWRMVILDLTAKPKFKDRVEHDLFYEQKNMESLNRMNR